MASVFKSVLITGAPGVGKSTLTKGLTSTYKDVRSFNYGQILLEFIRRRHRDATYEDMRERSSELVTPEDVVQADHMVVERLQVELRSAHMLLDSHAVTFESYGNRVTAYNRTEVESLNLGCVIVIELAPEELLSRATADPKGRTWSTAVQAERLQRLQSSLAMTYAVLAGCRMFVLDGSAPPDELLDSSADVLGSVGIELVRH